jgi:haloalkane dehalogenase
MQVMRTPDDRFVGLPDFSFSPHYVELPPHDGTTLRMAFVDEGPRAADPVLLLHGEPSWSFLYRKMVPPLVAAGHRVVAPDLIGFGRSDKPAERSDYSYQRHMDWLTQFLLAIDLSRITLVCQDWGGLLGLRLAVEQAPRFARIVAANTFLPTGDGKPAEAFFAWQRFSQEVPELPVGAIVKSGCVTPLPPEVVAAYDAPFPDERYKAGARQFPMLVPTRPNDPAAPANRHAWTLLEKWDRPFLTAFSDGDAMTRGLDQPLQRIPGAKGQPHVTIKNGGHFLQEDQGPELARVVADFIARTR